MLIAQREENGAAMVESSSAWLPDLIDGQAFAITTGIHFAGGLNKFSSKVEGNGNRPISIWLGGRMPLR